MLEFGLADLRILKGLTIQDPDFFRMMEDNYHHVGGARMGWSEADGVVDTDLKVFGTDNLYVLGAATFRTASNANTTFVALSFATRLAERLGVEKS
jgi:choline dehydrogenase-like flavoprotein